MEIRKITRDELPEAQRLMSLAFEIPLTDVKYFPPWEYHWAAFADDGRISSTVVSLPFTAFFEGKPAGLAGIGGVTSHPAHRGGGAITRLFRSAFEEMRERGDVFSYLYPFSFGFYRRMGYEHCGTTVFWKIKLSVLPKIKEVGGSFHLLEDYSDLSEIDKVYTSFAAHQNLMLRRDDQHYKKVLGNGQLYEAAPQFTYLWKDSRGMPAGYLTFSSEMAPASVMQVTEFCYSTPEAMNALLSFVGSFSSRYEYARFKLPDHVSLAPYISEYKGDAVERTLKFTGMAKVVDVQKALSMMTCPKTGSFTIAVTDENRTLLVETSPEGTEVKETDRSPQLRVTIQMLTRMVLGDISFDDARQFPGVSVDAENEIFSSFFRKRKLWINDFF